MSGTKPKDDPCGETREPYTKDERIAKAERARDNALDWLLECSAKHEVKGSATALDMWQRLEEKIVWLRRMIEGGDVDDSQRFAWADDAPPEPEAEA